MSLLVEKHKRHSKQLHISNQSVRRYAALHCHFIELSKHKHREHKVFNYIEYLLAES